MTRLLIPLLILTSLAGCKYSEEPVVVNVNDEYMLTLPSYMQETDDLLEGANCQYKNKYRNLYLIVLEDEKTVEFADYRDEGVSRIQTYLDDPLVYDEEEMTVNELPATLTLIYGKMEKEEVYYNHLTVNGTDQYYQVVFWTRGPERKDLYHNMMLEALASFQEI